MKQESIFNMIDKKIIQSLIDGTAPSFIQKDLNTNISRFLYNIQKDDKTVDVLRLLKMKAETITPSKTKYQIMYIKVCAQRVKDLDWLINNKYKFPKIPNSQVFKLIKLKEKLSIENALPF